jgi:hypothetical protein
MKVIYQTDFGGTQYRIVKMESGTIIVEVYLNAYDGWQWITGQGQSFTRNENYRDIIFEAIQFGYVKLVAIDK